MRTDASFGSDREPTQLRRFGLLVKSWRERDPLNVVSHNAIQDAEGPSRATQSRIEGGTAATISRKTLARYDMAFRAIDPSLPKGCVTAAFDHGVAIGTARVGEDAVPAGPGEDEIEAWLAAAKKLRPEDRTVKDLVEALEGLDITLVSARKLSVDDGERGVQLDLDWTNLVALVRALREIPRPEQQ